MVVVKHKLKKLIILILFLMLIPSSIKSATLIMGINTNNSIPYSIVVTNAASSILSTSATLNGTAYNYNSAGVYFFRYGLTSSYGSVTASSAFGANTTTQSFSVNQTGLTLATIYHFKACVTNNAGESCGADQTVTTSGFTQVALLDTGVVANQVSTSQIDLANNNLYVAGINNTTTDTSVFKINLTTFAVTSTLSLTMFACGGTTEVSAIAPNFSANTIYVSRRCTSSNTSRLWEISTSTMAVVAQNDITIIQFGFIYLAGTLYGCTNSSNIQYISPSTLTVSSTKALNPGYSCLGLLTDGTHRYGLNETGDPVLMNIDDSPGTAKSFAGFFDPSLRPQIATYDSTNNKIYISVGATSNSKQTILSYDISGGTATQLVQAPACNTVGTNWAGIVTDGTYVFINCNAPAVPFTAIQFSIAGASIANSFQFTNSTDFNAYDLTIDPTNHFVYYTGLGAIGGIDHIVVVKTRYG